MRINYEKQSNEQIEFNYTCRLSLNYSFVLVSRCYLLHCSSIAIAPMPKLDTMQMDRRDGPFDPFNEHFEYQLEEFRSHLIDLGERCDDGWEWE